MTSFFFSDDGDETSAIDKASRKRPRSDDEAEIINSEDEDIVPDDVEMLMLKAEALVHLHQPLEAVQSLNRYRVCSKLYNPTFIIRKSRLAASRLHQFQGSIAQRA